MFATHGYPLSLKSDHGRQLISAEFEKYLEENGIEHRSGPALWPQANGVERQNRTLLKAMRIAYAEGKDWRHELSKLLMAYRTTPHEVTGVPPAKRMFGRDIRTKLPEFREDERERDMAAQDRDAEAKQKGKDDADVRHRARPSDLEVGDTVLMEQQKQNKLSTRYNWTPLKVVHRQGSKVTVESPAGKRYLRNPAHLRKFVERVTVSGEKEREWEHPPEAESDETRSDEVDRGSTDSVTELESDVLDGDDDYVTGSGRVSRVPMRFKE